MTNTQLSYWANRETQRNNVEVNAETQRANKAREQELNRHNLALEAIEREKMANTFSISTLDRTERAREADQALAEQTRANREKERQNSAALDISAGQLEATMTRNANDLRTNLASIAETAAHNRAVELETMTHNRVQETEQNRANVASEQIRSEANRIQSAHNTQTENIQRLGVVTGVGNLGATNTRNDIQQDYNAQSIATSRRQQNLTTLSNLMQLGMQFYQTNVPNISIRGGAK